MDFRPNRNTLITNYLLTFGVVVLIGYFSLRNPTTYYYSPEYSSHGSYGSITGAQSCRQCHIQPFTPFDEKTCWTSGCHSNFEPDGRKPTDEMLVLTKSESSGELRDDYGAVLAFHKLLQGNMSCDECHPSHRLPQTGRFNHTTLLVDLERRLAAVPPKDPSPAGLKAVRAELFHQKAELFTGKVSCQSCHVNVPESGNAQRAEAVPFGFAPAMPNSPSVSATLPAAGVRSPPPNLGDILSQP